MTIVHDIQIAAAGLAAAGIGWIGYVLIVCRPVLGRTVSSDYDEHAQWVDRGFDWSSGPHARRNNRVRPVHAQVRFCVDGDTHIDDVTLVTQCGMAPDSTPIVWVDPKHPDRASARGPGLGVVLLIVAGGLLATAYALQKAIDTHPAPRGTLTAARS